MSSHILKESNSTYRWCEQGFSRAIEKLSLMCIKIYHLLYMNSTPFHWNIRFFLNTFVEDFSFQLLLCVANFVWDLWIWEAFRKWTQNLWWVIDFLWTYLNLLCISWSRSKWSSSCLIFFFMRSHNICQHCFCSVRNFINSPTSFLKVFWSHDKLFYIFLSCNSPKAQAMFQRGSYNNIIKCWSWMLEIFKRHLQPCHCHRADV